MSWHQLTLLLFLTFCGGGLFGACVFTWLQQSKLFDSAFPEQPAAPPASPSRRRTIDATCPCGSKAVTLRLDRDGFVVFRHCFSCGAWVGDRIHRPRRQILTSQQP